MQFFDFFKEIFRWFAENISGICVSILASVFLALVPFVSKKIKKVYEHVSWKDGKGTKYIIARYFKDETTKVIVCKLLIFFIKTFEMFVPFLIMLIVIEIDIFLIKYDVVGIAVAGVFFVFITVWYTLHRQKNRISNVKRHNIIDVFLIGLALLFSFVLIVMALLVTGDENSIQYIAVISFLLFLPLFFWIESRNSEEYFFQLIKKIKWIRYTGMVIGYAIFFDEFNDIGFSIIFYTCFFTCVIEQICSDLFGKNSLVLYTIKCTAGDYETHDNILQMKDGKVNFKKDDREVYIINKEEITCIKYKVKIFSKYGNKNQMKIKYMMNDGKEEICDKYIYLEEDWIEFIKWDAGNRESTIIPSNRIKCIMSCK